MVLGCLLAAGCSQGVQEAHVPKDNLPEQAASKYERVFDASGGEKRPRYIPAEERQVDYVEIGPPLSVSLGHAVDGGAWKMAKHDGGIIGFADGSREELKSLTLVFDNYTNKLVAIEVP